MKNRALTPLLLVLVMAGYGGSSLADRGRFEAQIEQYSRMLGSLEEEDETRHATSELGEMQRWLLETRMLLREDKEDDLEPLLRRVKAQVRLIQARIALGLAERRAETQEAEADALELTLSKLKRDTELAKKRLEVLREQREARAHRARAAPPGQPARTTGTTEDRQIAPSATRSGPEAPGRSED